MLRGVKAWAISIAVLLLIVVGLGFWLQRGQREISGEMDQAVTENEKLRQEILAYPEVEARLRQTETNKDAAALEESVYAELGRRLGVDAKTLKETAARSFENWKQAPDATAFEKATAAYVARNYDEAEKLSVEAAEGGKSVDAFRAFRLAGLAAQARSKFDTALEHFAAAEKLTDPRRDLETWAVVQEEVAGVLSQQGNYQREEEVLRKVIELRTRKFGAQARETLEARARLAAAKSHLTRSANAESEFRELIKLDEKLLGPEDPVTLWCRDSLALTLSNQGKYAEAESEFRDLMKLNEKIRGSEHPATLHARNNVARMVMFRGNNAEAKIEFTALAHLAERLFGPEHPDTLLFRSNLAVALMALREFADAETELREVLRLRTKVLGAEHRDTLKTRGILAQVLDKEDKIDEAEALYRETLAQTEKLYGPDDPETINAYASLGISLERHYHMRAAQPIMETALERARRVFGRDHPTTKSYLDVVEAIQATMHLDRP